MAKTVSPLLLSVVIGGLLCDSLAAQQYDAPDRGQPGDEMIQGYLAHQAEQIHAGFADDVKSLDEWKAKRNRYRDEYFYMLGLSPLPARTPLQATVTGRRQGDGYEVEMLHYQSIPQLYVTANLYRPVDVESGKRLPAVLYVCGHSSRGRSGNKTAFQSHGIWFARHGYVCLMVDTLQLGEIAAIHHGTYREGRWWWHSRGYTPAGVECWNGIRGIDYLISRPDVDPQRIAVTGISGGGAATFWVAAADERASVAIPVSGMADLPSYVAQRVINGHCDCMFLYNTFQWPWTRIASLVAPRPLLFVNSDQDRIFPMDANERVINRLERVYSLYGAGDRVDSLVSMGGHDYRQDIRQATFRFVNEYLKGDPRQVEDSEVDLVTSERNDPQHPIPPEQLRAFPADADIPADQLNTTIDQFFVPQAVVALPESGKFEQWRAGLRQQLQRTTFRSFPERIEPARKRRSLSPVSEQLETESGILVRLDVDQRGAAPGSAVTRRLLLVSDPDSDETSTGGFAKVLGPGDQLLICQPRGTGEKRWTLKSPPNYVARSHVLLGLTVDLGRVYDVAATARYVREKYGDDVPLVVLGDGPAGVIGAYAALWEPDIAGAALRRPPLSHMEQGAPQLLSVLRSCDVLEVLGMLAPRPLTVVDQPDSRLDRVAAIYAAAGAAEQFQRK